LSGSAPARLPPSLGQLHFGLISARELIPDIDILAGYLTDELALLAEAADKRIANAPS